MTTTPSSHAVRRRGNSLLRNLLLAMLSAFLVAAFSGAGSMTARAQDAAAPAAEAPAKGSKDKTLMAILKDAGVTTWVCMFLSVLVMGFTIEGFIKFRFVALAPPAHLEKLKELVAYGNYQEAWQFCQENTSFLCTVAGAGLERVGRGPEAVEHTLEEVSAQQAVILKTNMNYLSVIGVVAPMIGLSGTVLGMIRAFNSLGASGIGDPSGLAAAIGEVLVSTASGLIVAIPGFVFYYVFKSRALTSVMLADSAIYRLFDGLPYDQLLGLNIGESATAPAYATEAQ